MNTETFNANPQQQQRPEQSLAQIIAFAKRGKEIQAAQQAKAPEEDNVLKRIERHSKKASELVQLIRDGNFNHLESLIRSYCDDPKELADVANVARFRLNCNELAIPYTTVSTGQPLPDGKRADMVMFMIRFQTVQRVLCIPSHRAYPSRVYGPPRGGSGFLAVPMPEDPSLLCKQIGRIASLNHFVAPPPLARR